MKRTARKSEIPKLANEILTYLTKHPDAMDTIEGIVEWWLLEQRVERQSARVRHALAVLVARELVIEREGRDSRVYYRINDRKANEILMLLRRRQS